MNIKFGYWIVAGMFLVAGCVSVPSSREPRFYGIAALNEHEVKTVALSSDFAVAVSGIKIPGYLTRPHIVTQDEGHQMHFAQFDRWAEPLNEGMTRVIKENLSLILPSAQIISYPLDFPADAAFRVEMEVTRFELDLNGQLFLAVQWAVIDVGYPKNTLIQRSEFRLPVEHGKYSSAVNALSAACASLSGEISQGISRMSEVVHP
jgi:uncharacterized lipoprotein YmbA